ncbi:TonB-dependent receptor [Caulobacter hibisci]|uniref:TonB-dependent receptor n=1 Tax=Caulobacter hibisci TaxID=2035993 RepID=A0ABS0T1H1_9CAUL|nr:TonB-dependent receptor [Caulobacter hibisci]MBI1685721.1 TonB-dependent receptor [Caulobacter hibisci]
MALGGMLLHGFAAALAVAGLQPGETKLAEPAGAETTSPDAKSSDAKSSATSVATPAAATAPAETVPAETTSNDTDAVSGVTVDAAPRGKTEGTIEPEQVLDEADIQAYGAGSLAELVTALAPLTVSARGRGGDEPPIILINGQRISGPQEMSGIPPEAVLKAEIYPEEKALAYGYRADQKVLNFVLKKDFSQRTLEDERRWATEGGRTFSEQRGGQFKVDADARWTINARYRRETPLYEQERDVERSVSTPYDLQGNIFGKRTDGQIDPALSALAGTSVTMASVPVGLAGGTASLADFVAGANITAADDLTASRTLLPRGEEGAIQGAYSRNFGKTTVSVSGNLESTSRVSYLGLPGVKLELTSDNPFSPFAEDVTLYRYIDAPDALRRKVDTDKVELAATALGMLAGWRWTASGNFDMTDSATRTGRGLDTTAYAAAVKAGDPAVDPFGAVPASLLRYAAQDTADSVTTNAKAEFTAAGSLLQLPAGRLRATVKSGFDSRKVEADSVRSGVPAQRDLTRDRATASASFDLPLLERGEGRLGFLGSVSLNGNGLYERFSDIGGLVTVGGGVSWQPIKGVSLGLNYSTEEGEPTPQQVNDPQVLTPNVSMYDFATGDTVAVTRIEGGNPNLKPDSRQVVKLNFFYKPFEKRDLFVWGNYTASRIDDQIASFPSISPELESAFPSRFVREVVPETDPDYPNKIGRLLSVDSRPVNFAHADNQILRWGLNYNLRWGGPPAPAAGPKPGAAPTTAAPAAGPRGPTSPAGGAASGPRPGGGIQVSGGGMTMRTGGGAVPPGQTRLQVSVNHTWRVKDEVVIRKGLAPLDLLDGASLGRRGGTPRHEIYAQAQLSRSGMGATLRGSWRSSTWVDGGTRGDDLYFSDLPTLGLQGYLDLDVNKDWTKRYGWLRGSRLTLGVDNLFDTKQVVRNDKGETPKAYRKDYMDPAGRTVRAGLRKVF